VQSAPPAAPEPAAIAVPARTPKNPALFDH
jgi:hypothetical protein